MQDWAYEASKAIWALLDDVANRHNIKDRNDFTCPYMRKLSYLVDWTKIKKEEI
jgi:hypothetical protein